MKVTRFDPSDTLIIITARIWGPLGDDQVSLAFDTAATQTHVVPEFLEQIGYGPQHGDRITSITSAIGDEPGYMMPVTRFSALGSRCPTSGSTCTTCPTPSASRDCSV